MRRQNKHIDSELIASIKAGGDKAEQAFNDIYNKYQGRLYGYCLYKSPTRQEAEELFQDVWVRFYKAVTEGKAPATILSFLILIARNQSIDRFRARQATKNIDLRFLNENTLERLANPLDLSCDLEGRELIELVKLSVNCLDDKYKDIIVMYWFGDMDIKEIAGLCHETDACIRMRLNRAFSKLAELIRPYMVGTE